MSRVRRRGTHVFSARYVWFSSCQLRATATALGETGYRVLHMPAASATAWSVPNMARTRPEQANARSLSCRAVSASAACRLGQLSLPMRADSAASARCSCRQTAHRTYSQSDQTGPAMPRAHALTGPTEQDTPSQTPLGQPPAAASRVFVRTSRPREVNTLSSASRWALPHPPPPALSARPREAPIDKSTMQCR